MNNMELYEAFRVVPQNAKKEITGGRLKGMTDINPMWRIKVLTEKFGPVGIGWYYKIIDRWSETIGEESCAFVNIELYIKVNGEWSMPIIGTGGSKLATIEKNGKFVSDECYKMATTDALSVACKNLGIGADVYWDKDKTKYIDPTKEEPKQDSRLLPVYVELKRTGYTEASICKTYKIDSINAMSDLQIKDFLTKIKNVPNKE